MMGPMQMAPMAVDPLPGKKGKSGKKSKKSKSKTKLSAYEKQ